MAVYEMVDEEEQRTQQQIPSETRSELNAGGGA